MKASVFVMLIGTTIGTSLVSGQPWMSPSRYVNRFYGQKKISDPAEYSAYMQALHEINAEKRAAAMEAFLVRFPKSNVKLDAMEQAMAAYQKAGSPDHVLDMANRILQIDPDHVRALSARIVLLKAQIVQGKTEFSVQQLIAESQRGLEILNKWKKPDGMADDLFKQLQKQMTWIFHGAAGFGFLKSKDFSAARASYQKALEVYPEDGLTAFQLGIADLESDPADVNGFWYIAKSSILLPKTKQGIEAYGRCQYVSYHGAEAGWDQIMSEVATEAKPPVGFSITPGPGMGTVCKFDGGPRAGSTQNYAPPPGLPVNNACQDSSGSRGHIIATKPDCSNQDVAVLLAQLGYRQDVQPPIAGQKNSEPSQIVPAKIHELEDAITANQRTGNQSGAADTARQLLQIDSENVVALAALTSFELSRQDPNSIVEARRHGEKGMLALAAWQKRPETPESAFEELRKNYTATFIEAIAFGGLQAKDYVAARDSYLKLLAMNRDTMTIHYQLGIAELEMKPLDVQGFWHIAKAIQLASGTFGAERVAEYGKAKYGSYHGSDDGWKEMLATVASQTAPPPDWNVKGVPLQERACKAAQENDPAQLSFADWMLVLSFHDASPCNREAADKIWLMIQNKQRNGKARLRIPIKIISATNDNIEAAIAVRDRPLDKADLHIALEKPMSRPPAPGTFTEAIGVLTNYTPEPFLFFMEHGSVPPAH